MAEKKPDTLSWGLMLLLSLIWGSSFILIKKGLMAFSPQQVATLRIFIAFLALLPFIILKIRRVFKNKLLYVFFVGLLGSGIPPLLFATAQTKIDSSIAGILNSLTPLFTILLGVLLFRAKTTLLSTSGVILGLIGAAVLMLFKANGVFEINYLHSVLIILATISYATSINMIKSYLQDKPPLDITIIVFLMIGPPAGIYLFSN